MPRFIHKSESQSPLLRRVRKIPIGPRLKPALVARLDALVELMGGPQITTRTALAAVAIERGIEWLEHELPKRRLLRTAAGGSNR